VTLEQDKILKVISAWADKYPCIKAMYVFGSVARNEATATSDLDIAFEYVSEVRSYESNAVGCYTTVNDQWEQLVEELKQICRYQPSQTGLSPFSDSYDHKAWSYIRNGREIGRYGKVILTWTARKPIIA
jgi:predicted nucleotidyltransferase